MHLDNNISIAHCLSAAHGTRAVQVLLRPPDQHAFEAAFHASKNAFTLAFEFRFQFALQHDDLLDD
jgi:hypothetical protein